MVRIKDMNNAGIVNSLFGKADQVLVTRRQLGEVAGRIASTMDIFEDLESDRTFSEEFPNSIVSRAAHRQDVPFHTALASLSALTMPTFAADIQPSTITKQAGKVFVLRDRASKNSSRRVLDVLDRGKTWDSVEKGSVGSAKFLGLFGGSGRYKQALVLACLRALA